MSKLLRTVVIEESFDLSGRGAAAVFLGTIEGLPLGVVLPICITRPDESIISANATIELLLRRASPPVERSALLVQELTKSEVPPRSRVEIFSTAQMGPTDVSQEQ